MFKHLLGNHTPLEKQLERTSGEAVEALQIPIRAIHDPAACPASLLPWLAWERSVDYWRDDWSEQTKRNVIAASVAVHRKKGTLLAVRDAIAATGLVADVTVNSRNASGYVPHTFAVRVDADANPPTAGNALEIRYQVDHVKPARCAYTLSFLQNAAATSPSSRAAALSLGKETIAASRYRQSVPAVRQVWHGAQGLTLMREAA